MKSSDNTFFITIFALGMMGLVAFLILRDKKETPALTGTPGLGDGTRGISMKELDKILEKRDKQLLNNFFYNRDVKPQYEV